MQSVAPQESRMHGLVESPMRALMCNSPPSDHVVNLHAPMTQFFTPFGTTDLQCTWDGPVGYPYGSRYKRVNTSLEAQGIEQVLCGVLKFANPVAPYTWQIKTGSLPPGMSLDSSTPDHCYFTGTPSTVGDYTFTVGIKKNGLWRGQRECTIRVVKPLLISNLSELNDAMTSNGGWVVQSVLLPMSEPSTNPPSKLLYYEQSISLTVQPYPSYWGMGYTPSGEAGSPSYIDVIIAWNSGYGSYVLYLANNIARALTYAKSADLTSPLGVYTINADQFELEAWPDWTVLPVTLTIAEA